MYDNIMSVSDSVCTGCSACMNACPVDAIRMQYNEEGFLMPFAVDDKCIGCGECNKKCPVLHPHYNNEEKPKIFAAMAADDVRSKSSSGGMFTLIAEEILDCGGLVCGAAFDDDFRLSHVITDSKQELEPLKKSKYAQSNIDYTYRKIKKLLDSGRKVLFTGTPCQVAGIKSYLGKDYNDFYAVDILCHGVPSDTVLKKYIDEVALKHTEKASSLKNIQFRNKEFGWTCKTIYLEFENCDRPYVSSKDDGDLFQYMFQNNLILRKSCADCRFAVYPRQGDMSIGDFWGITRIDKRMNDKKGTSIVFINNDKGMELFSCIHDSLKKFKEINIHHDLIRNRIKADQEASENRDDFLKMVRTKTIEEAIDIIKKKYESQEDEDDDE